MDQPASDPSQSSYRGSHIFSFAAKYSGLQLDQFNFILSELLALVFAICFRRYLPPKPSNVLKRHLTGKTFFLRRASIASKKISDAKACLSFSESSRYCVGPILFWFADLALDLTIMCILPDALFYPSETFIQGRLCLLYALPQCE